MSSRRGKRWAAEKLQKNLKCKTQAANVANEARLRAEYENFQGKDYKHIQWGNHQKFKVINNFIPDSKTA